MKYIAFDAEFAINEVLELSVYHWDSETPDEQPAEVFHQYFKPRNEHRWPGSERVHHISPRMVAHRPHFSRFRDMVQRLVDEADCLVGFAIQNDIDALAREGIKGLDRKLAVDVRDMHWLCHGRLAGIELDSRRGLSVTAGELGIDFSESDAHGASYDTLKTMQCFVRLIQDFEDMSLREAAGTGQEVSEDGFLARYLQKWDTEREKYYREYAKGWIALVEAREGYRLKASRIAPPSGDKVVSVIHVMARMRGLDEIDARFTRKRHPEDRHVYCLDDSDIRWFAGYSNEYDAQESLHRKMQELRAHGGLFG